MDKDNLTELEEELLKCNMSDSNSILGFVENKKRLLKRKNEKNLERILEILVKCDNKGYNVLLEITEIMNENDMRFFYIFERGINHTEKAYSLIEGLLKSDKKKAYPILIDLIKNKNYKIETRAKAIKEISKYSGQKFDRNLTIEMHEWTEENIQERLKEIESWYEAGCPIGEGYSEPTQHESLKNPTTEVEKAAAVFAEKLKKVRDTAYDKQDLACPTNWIIPANEGYLKKIKEKWNLPEKYLEFLEKFSPLRIKIESRKFSCYLWFYGANELIENQKGYSYNDKEGVLEDWPKNMIVIADDGADPFCLDLSKMKNGDAPVMKSSHGEGEWVFKKYTNSFIEFLGKII